MATQPPPSGPATHDVAKWLAVGNVILALVLAFLFVSWRSESTELEQSRAREAVTGVARALAQGLNGDMERADGVLKSAVAAFERASEAGPVQDSPLADVLPDLRAGLADAEALLVCDADGNVRLGLPEGAPPVNVARRDFFVAARAADPSALPVLSRPWRHPASGKWIVSVARPLRTPSGAFVGTVHADLGSEDFARRLAGVPLGQDGVVALRTADMALIARITTEGVSNESLGNTTISAGLKAALASEPSSGYLLSRSPRDGIVRALAYQRVAGFPLYVIVGQGSADSFADAAALPGH